MQERLDKASSKVVQKRDLYTDGFAILGNEDRISAYFTIKDQQIEVQKEAVAR